MKNNYKMKWGPVAMTHEEEQHYLETLSLIAQAIAQMFGERCEVCVSDLDHPDEAVLYIYNGHITNRQVGSPLIAEAEHRVNDTNENIFVNYRKTIRANGPTIKSSTIVRKIGERTISFCINYDCTLLEGLQGELSQFLSMSSRQEQMDILGINEPTTLQSIIEKSVRSRNKPVSAFKKADRLAVVRDLDEKGILQIQNSVRLIANALEVSRFSIYNYLKEARGEA